VPEFVRTVKAEPSNVSSCTPSKTKMLFSEILEPTYRFPIPEYLAANGDDDICDVHYNEDFANNHSDESFEANMADKMSSSLRNADTAANADDGEQDLDTDLASRMGMSNIA
jgi:alcohol dehydrogenase YqhD (iron-dependent ADH family)